MCMMEGLDIRKQKFLNFGFEPTEEKEGVAVTSDLDLTSQSSEDTNSCVSGVQEGPAKDDVSKGRVLQVWRDFLLQTSLHGCRHVGERQRPVLTRCVWATITVAMAVGLGFGLLRLMLCYLEYPFSTEWGLRRDSEIPYPAITLCLPSLLDYGRYNASKELIRLLNGFAPNVSGDVPKEFSMNHSEFDALAGFRTEDVFLAAKVTRYENISGEALLRKRMGRGGTCWTINELTSEGGYSDLKAGEFDFVWVMINVPDVRAANRNNLNGVQLFIHPPEVPFWNQKNVNIPPGASTVVTFSKTEISFLPLPYKSFSEHGCIEKDSSFKNPLHSFPVYSFAGCSYEKATEFGASVCKCVSKEDLPFFDYPECTVEARSRCLWPQLELFFKHQVMVSPMGQNLCPSVCSSSEYDVQVTSGWFLPPEVTGESWFANHPSTKGETRNVTTITIQPRNTVVTTLKHVPELTFLTVLGTVGGYMGLFLGASLLSATEVLEAVLLSAWRLTRSLARAR